MPGFLIAIEGIDGTGKSTQANLLVSRLKAKGIDCIQTFEPGDNSIGSSLRSILFSGNADPVTEAYLFCADRAMHVREIVKPALNAGKCVVSDRFVLSSIAYQGYGKDLDPDWIRLINVKAVDGIIPDLTIVLDAPVKTGLGRAKCDNHFENSPLLEKVREGFLLEEKKHPDIIKIVDATNDINSIANEIFELVTKKMEV
ncbi:MAG: dTMP kinase [Caldiserica bacterium]|nr:dTMP kinase [Caldisericota bacterium]